MPNRIGHQRITTILLATSALSLLVLPLDWYDEQAAFLIGVALTLAPQLTPDLDVNGRKFGWVGELIGMNSYAKAIPHRFGMHKKHWRKPESILLMSHVPLFGTLFRVIMLGTPAVILALLTGIDISGMMYYVIFVWLGMSLSDLFHVIADKLTGDLKEIRRDFWKRRMDYAKKNPGDYPVRYRQ